MSEDESEPVILVVDDDTTTVTVLGRMLNEDYIVHVATNGERALEIAGDKIPDLILLDMVMPEMSGIDVCTKLKESDRTRNIPVIFVTSMDDRHHEAQGFKAGAVDYITKPCSPEIVLARVGVHIALNKQIRFLKQVAGGHLSDVSEIKQQAEAILRS